MATGVYETIKASHELPSPTGVALHVLEISRHSDSTVDQIATAVESDPALASKLLKLVNSSLAGLPRQIASVHRAVALLGVKVVTSLALSFSLISEHRRGRCPAFNYESFWSESVGRAAAARHLAHRVGKFAPDEVFTCGLLCQIGQLALATAFAERYANVLRSATAGTPGELAELEREVFDIDHDDLSAEMMRDWHMPTIFCEAVRVQSSPESGEYDADSRCCLVARILNLAGPIAQVLTRQSVSSETLTALVPEANRLGISPYCYYETFDAISHEWREAGAILSVRTRPVPPLSEIFAQAQEQKALLEQMHDTATSSTAGEVRSAR